MLLFDLKPLGNLFLTCPCIPSSIISVKSHHPFISSPRLKFWIYPSWQFTVSKTKLKVLNTRLILEAEFSQLGHAFWAAGRDDRDSRRHPLRGAGHSAGPGFWRRSHGPAPPRPAVPGAEAPRLERRLRKTQERTVRRRRRPAGISKQVRDAPGGRLIAPRDRVVLAGWP